MYEAGRAHADAGLPQAYPNDNDYVEGYMASEQVVSSAAPVDKQAPITITLSPRQAKAMFRGLATSIGLGLPVQLEGASWEAWHTLADATFEQAYGTTADALNESDPIEGQNADDIREQLGLQLAGLPMWFFDIRGAVEKVFGEQQLVASTEGVPLQ